MKFFVTLVLVATFLIDIPFAHAASTATPRIANIFLSWNITRAQAMQLARWDVVVLDAEIGARQKNLIALMRARNPRIKIFAYISAIEIHKLNDDLSQESPLRGKLHARLSDDVFLKNANGERTSFWKSAHLLNPSSEWKHLLPQYIREEIITAGVWDGIMLDNVWDGVTWYVGDVDLNNDGIADDTDKLNAKWKVAMHELINNIRLQSPNIIIIGNGSTKFTELDGIVFENFPRHGWNETISRLQEFRSTHAGPTFNIINVNAGNTVAAISRDTMQFGLASSLLVDAYFSYDLGDASHAAHWWYPDYTLATGEATGPSREIAPSIWQRDFTHATILVNSSESSSLILRTKNAKKILKQKFPLTLRANIFGSKQKERVVIREAPFQILISIYNLRGEQIHSFVLERQHDEAVTFSVSDANRDGVDEITMQRLSTPVAP